MTRIKIRDYLLPKVESICTREIEDNQELRDRVLEAFTLYDKDRTKMIDTKNLARIIRSLGQTPTVCEETDIVAEYAQKNCHEINFIEFFRLVTKRWQRVFDEDDELRECFRSFDKEENGFINELELREMLTTMGEPLTEKEVDEWMEDGKDYILEGRVYYEEFARFMLSK